MLTTFKQMFRNATNFNQSINQKEVTRVDGSSYTAWNVSNCLDFRSMFYDCTQFTNI